MNRRYIFIASMLSIFMINSKSYSQNEFPDLEGPYMGQKTPGMIAEPFASDIISTKGWEVGGVFSQDMKEFYFTTDNGKGTPVTVLGFRQRNNIWTKYTEFERKGEILFSPDGKRMHMAEGYKDRIGGDRKDWGVMRLSASAKGSYVFYDYKNKVIRISTFKEGKRQSPIAMGSMINTGKFTAHPFIASDESYIIWDSVRKGGYGGSDLYISFKQKDASWGAAINMGDKINSDKNDNGANVTSNGEYMFFNRRMDDTGDNIDIYWVDAKIIEKLRPKF